MPIKPQASREKEKARLALLRAAKNLFARKGYDGTSVKELAGQAGVNVSLVSYYFGGKKGLYRCCLDQFGKDRLATAERILQPPSSSEEFRVRLKMFIQELFHCHLGEPELAAMIHREVEQALPIIPDLFKESFLKVFETALEFMRVAQKKKICVLTIDPQHAIGMLFGSVFHFCKSDHIAKRYFGKTIQDPENREQIVEAIFDIFTSGVQR